MMVFNSLIFIGLAALWWHQSNRRHYRVRELLLRWCKGQGFTLIDDTVVWRGFQRQKPGEWRFFWVYQFEISPDGLKRTGGQVLLDTSINERAWLSIDKGEHQVFETLTE
jgi:hypothetical protein